MPKPFIKISLVTIGVVLLMLYALDYAESLYKKPKKLAPPGVLVIAPNTNPVSFNREALLKMVDHVRDDILVATNANELSTLRMMENSLTNALSR